MYLHYGGGGAAAKSGKQRGGGKRGVARRGDPLAGVFLTGIVSGKREDFGWNSGITQFWGISSGRWRSARWNGEQEQRGVIIENGWVREIDGLDDSDSDSDSDSDDEDEEGDRDITANGVLNASGVVHGHGEHLGVLVDMDEGFVAFFRDGKLIDSILPDDFPLLEHDFCECVYFDLSSLYAA